jgi:hypothetical protein
MFGLKIFSSPLRSSGCRLISNTSENHRVSEQFSTLVTIQPDSVNSLPWKQFMNQLIGNSRGVDGVVGGIGTKTLVPVISHISGYPNQERFHEFWTRIIGRLNLVGEIAFEDRIEILQYLLKSGIRIGSPEILRYQKNQYGECIVAVRDLVGNGMTDLANANGRDGLAINELLFLFAMAKQQGWISKVPEQIANIGLHNILQIVPNLPFQKRAELAWAMSILGIETAYSNFFTVSDLLSFQYHSNSTSIYLSPRKDVYRLVQLYDAFRSNDQVPDILLDLLGPISSDPRVACGIIASHSLWWRAISGGRLDALAANFMLVCMNKSETLSERDRWISRMALRSLKPDPKLDDRTKSQWEHCVKNDIIGRPKRSSLSWRNSSQVANSFSFR